MNYNEYREIINGVETYKGIAQRLKENKLVGIGWTDNEIAELINGIIKELWGDKSEL